MVKTGSRASNASRAISEIMTMRKTVALLLLASFPWLPTFGLDNSSAPAVAAPSGASAPVNVAPAQAPSGAVPTAAEINRPIRDKWALVVGVSKFQNNTVPTLRYAAKDARDFRNFLVNEANFAPDHVRLLLDEDATQRRVVSELGSKFLARVAKPDDVVVLFFSTHGSPSQLDLKGKNFLLSTDSDPEDLFATGIKMDDLMLYAKQRITCDRIFVVLDACHASGIAPGEKGVGRVPVIDPEELAQGSGKLIICSSSPEESSWESKRYQNGIFTRKLLEGLRASGKRTTLGEAFEFVEKSVAAEVQEDYAAKQTPVKRSMWNGNDLVLAVPAAAPQAVPVSVTSGLLPDSTMPKIPPKPGGKPIAGSPGDVLMRKGEAELAKNPPHAIELLKKSLTMAGTDLARANYSLGRAYAACSMNKEAMVAYRASIAADRSSPSAVLATQALNGGGAATRSSATSTGSRTGGYAATAPVTYQNYSNTTMWREGANNQNRNFTAPAGGVSSGGSIPTSVIDQIGKISPVADINPPAGRLAASLDTLEEGDCAARIVYAEKQYNYAESCLRRAKTYLQPYFGSMPEQCRALAQPFETYKDHWQCILNEEQKLQDTLVQHNAAKRAGTFGGYGGGYGYAGTTNNGTNCNTNQGGSQYSIGGQGYGYKHK